MASSAAASAPSPTRGPQSASEADSRPAEMSSSGGGPPFSAFFSSGPFYPLSQALLKQSLGLPGSILPIKTFEKMQLL